MYLYHATGQRMRQGGATITDVNIISRGHRQVWPAPRFGMHRLDFELEGPPIAGPTCVKANAVATATADQAGVGVHVGAGVLDAEDKFVVVSGLTYCIGLLAGRWTGTHFSAAVAAHFNGNYDNAQAWTRIQNGLTNGGGLIRAVVVLTEDSTSFDYKVLVKPAFERQLMALGVSPEHILFYWSNAGGLPFVLNGKGFIGEGNKDDFPR